MRAAPDYVAKLIDQLELTDVPCFDPGDCVKFVGLGCEHVFNLTTVEEDALEQQGDAILAVDNRKDFLVVMGVHPQLKTPVRTLAKNDHFAIGGRIFVVAGVDPRGPNLKQIGCAVSRERRISILRTRLSTDQATVQNSQMTEIHLKLKIEALQKELFSLNAEVAAASSRIPALEATIKAHDRREQIATEAAPNIAKLSRVVEQVQKLVAEGRNRKLTAEEQALLTALRDATKVGL